MRRKVGILLLVMCIGVLAFSGCTKENQKKTYNYSNSASKEYNADVTEITEEVTDAAVPESYENEAGSTEGSSTAVAEKSDGNNSTVSVNTNQKLIKTFALQIETKEYDKLLSSIQQKITSLGGYVESSNLQGNSYFGNNKRYGQIIARIPKARVDEFVNTVSKLGNVLNKTENTEDVTLAYVDVQSHQKTLKLEQERLLALLEKAEKLETIITLESRLSDIRYQIESYESQLRLYDNLVDYSTVTLDVNEVKEITEVEDEDESAFDRMKDGFVESVENIRKGLEDLMVDLVINLPYIIIWAIVIIIIGLYVRSKIKRRKNNRRSMEGIVSNPSTEKKETEKES